MDFHYPTELIRNWGEPITWHEWCSFSTAEDNVLIIKYSRMQN